jgi:hypothetical protein
MASQRQKTPTLDMTSALVLLINPLDTCIIFMTISVLLVMSNMM